MKKWFKNYQSEVAFTRLMTRTFLDKAKEKFRLKDQKCISYGPCQTPTLSFCIQRHKEIQQFKKEAYYILSPNIDVDVSRWVPVEYNV